MVVLYQFECKINKKLQSPKSHQWEDPSINGLQKRKLNLQRYPKPLPSGLFFYLLLSGIISNYDPAIV